MTGILLEIVNQRKKRLIQDGYTQNVDIPKKRQVPLVIFPQGSFICEIKRSSPSRGDFQRNNKDVIDPLSMAGMYAEKNINTISVLTEQDYFNGSLADLIAVKNEYPNKCILRKDFILHTQDIEISYRAGADAVLLMAAVLSDEELCVLYKEAQKYNVTAFVEVHTKEEAQRVMSCITCINDVSSKNKTQKFVLGINCRNLDTFVLDKLAPLEISEYVNVMYPDFIRSYVYESAIFYTSDVQLAHVSNCQTMLVGEAAVRFSHRISKWQLKSKQILSKTPEEKKTIKQIHTFWKDFITLKCLSSPLIKICGLCNLEDVKAALSYGADFLGFIQADSPRSVSREFLYTLYKNNTVPKHIKKIVVVVGAPDNEILDLVLSGVVDALQIHNAPKDLYLPVPWYRAVHMQSDDSINLVRESGTARVLIDAYSSHSDGNIKVGGTGKTIDDVFIRGVKKEVPLWLAGGLNAENIVQKICMYRPELVDIASGIEKKPGVKDHKLMQTFCKNVHRSNFAG